MIASLYLGNIALIVLNLPMIPLWVRLLKIPYWVLYPCILVLAVVGAYSVRGSMFDIYMLIFFSVLGYAFRKLAIPPTPLLMAFVLGPQAENAIRQSLILSDNSLLIFVQRPISAIVLGLAVIVVILAIASRRRGARLPTKDSAGPPDDDGPGLTPEDGDRPVDDPESGHPSRDYIDDITDEDHIPAGADAAPTALPNHQIPERSTQ